MSILAIDQGTTSTRSLVLDDSGHSLITSVIEHQQIYPKNNWVEHDPEELIVNIKSCIETSLEKFPDINAIGIDNQGESCLAWHADTKEALSPVIVWQDSRTQKEIESLKEAGLENKIIDLCGLPLDPYFSATKLSWLLKNVPAVKTAFEQGKLCLGTTDAFFLDRLTGEFVTDITTASRTALMNIHTGQWDETLCELFEVPIETLPKILPTTDDFGTVTFGDKIIPVKANICDQQASLYAHGCRKAGDIKITFGTGAFAFAITGDKPVLSPEQGLLPTAAWQIKNQSTCYALDGGVYNAGAAINWAKSLGLFKEYSELNQFSKRSAVENNLVFIPALSGLACPHWDRKAAGLWIGLSLDTTPLDMMQAVLEGIAFRATEVIQAMQNLTPIGNQISIDGGLSTNPYFCQFLANVLQKDIIIQKFSELTALGTALLTIDHDLPTNPQKHRRFTPQQDLSKGIKVFAKAISFSKGWNDN